MRKDTKGNTYINAEDLTRRLTFSCSETLLSDMRLAVPLMIEMMAATLEKGERIEIRGFGGFIPRWVPEHNWRSPITGKMVRIPGKYYPHFNMGSILKQRLNRSKDNE